MEVQKCHEITSQVGLLQKTSNSSEPRSELNTLTKSMNYIVGESNRWTHKIKEIWGDLKLKRKVETKD